MDPPQRPSPSPYIPNIDDIHPTESNSSHDPFRFSHGLAGVDQASNYLFANILLATALAPTIIALTLRILVSIRNDRRRVSAITSCRGEDFWKKDRHSWWSLLKRHFFYRLTHQQRRTKSSRSTSLAVELTLPRLLVILLYVLSNITYCLVIPAQPRLEMLVEFRGRCGVLAAFNLIFTVLFALRNNPMIWLLHVSYDTFNLFHRWTARLVVLESLGHASAFLYNTYQVEYNGKSGWHSIGWLLRRSSSYQFGLVALITFGLLMIHSIRPLRHAFYETFLTLHRIGIFVSLSGVYFHLAKHALPQLPWIYLIITLLAVEFLVRAARILFYNFSWRRRHWTRVELEALPGKATRVTFTLPRSWNANPGSHVHIYLPRIAPFGSHPFSVAWSQSFGTLSSEKLPYTTDDLEVNHGPSAISCIIRSRRGMTRSLYNLATKSESGQAHLWGAIEGPYGGRHSFDSYGTVVLFAGGVGITHQLSYVRHLVDAHNSSTAATRQILLVWCITDLTVLDWVLPWLEQLAAMQNFNDIVRIRLQVSRMTSLQLEGQSLPGYLDARPQRCDVQELIDEEALAQVGAMAVSVCGPTGLSGSVRAAVRRRVVVRSIDFFEEAFSY